LCCDLKVKNSQKSGLEGTAKVPVVFAHMQCRAS